MASDTPDYVVEIDSENMSVWKITLAGPSVSPYKGGLFVLQLDFPDQYPFKQPMMKFVTKVYHPSVMQTTGEICHNIITWAPTLTALTCIEAVYSLLADPQADHPVDDDIAQLLSTNRKEFEKKARKFTKEHAM